MIGNQSEIFQNLPAASTAAIPPAESLLWMQPAGQTYEVRHGFGNNYFYKGLHPRPVLLGRLSEGAGKSFRGCRACKAYQKKRDAVADAGGRKNMYL
jgi:hypothetical protein